MSPRHLFSLVGIGLSLAGSVFVASPALAADASATLYGFQLAPGVFGQYDHGTLTGAGRFAASPSTVGGYLSAGCAPVAIRAQNTGAATQDIHVYPAFDWSQNSNAIEQFTILTSRNADEPILNTDDLSDLAHTGQAATVATSTFSDAGMLRVSVLGPYAGTNAEKPKNIRQNDTVRFYDVTIQDVPAGATASLLFCATFGSVLPDASANPSIWLIGETAAPESDKITIDHTAIFFEPTLIISATSTDGLWPTATSTFTITPAINGEADGIQTVAIHSGIATAPIGFYMNQAIEREYHIAFTPPAGYKVIASSGPNSGCVVDGANAIATITPSQPDAAESSCMFTIEPLGPPRYRAMANIIGGNLSPNAVKMYIDGATVAHGVYSEYVPGVHSVFVETPVGYDRTGIHGDCDGAANITLAPGDEKTCTIDLTAARAYVTPVLNIVNDNGGSATTSDVGVSVGGVASSFGLRTLVNGTTTTVAISAPSGYATTFAGSCDANGLATVTLGDDATCTVTINDPAPANNGGGSGGGNGGGNGGSSGGGSSSGGSGGGSSGGSGGGATTSAGSSGIPSGGSGGGSSGGNASSTPVVVTPAPSILGRVLGDTFSDAASSCLTDEPDAAFITANPMDLLRSLGRILDAISPSNLALSLAQRVLPNDATDAERAAVNNFLSFGTRTSLKLGEGERAGVVDSFRAAFGRIPKSECDWQDALRIANGKQPGQRSPAREAQSATLFAKLFGRKPDANDATDRNAIDMMSYGIRPQSRDLTAETDAIRFFREKMGRAPANATDWDAMRAIAYAGVR